MAFDASPFPPNDPAFFAGSHSGQGVPGAADAGLLHALAQANHFTLEDVQVNRQGWMSPRQREEAKSSPLVWFCVALTTVGGAIVGGLWDIFGLPPEGDRDTLLTEEVISIIRVATTALTADQG